MKPILILVLLAIPSAALAQTPETGPDGRRLIPAPMPSQAEPPPPVPAIPPASSQNGGIVAPAEKTAPAGTPDSRSDAGPANSTPYSGAPSRTSDPQALPK